MRERQRIPRQRESRNRRVSGWPHEVLDWVATAIVLGAEERMHAPAGLDRPCSALWLAPVEVLSQRVIAGGKMNLTPHGAHKPHFSPAFPRKSSRPRIAQHPPTVSHCFTGVSISPSFPSSHYLKAVAPYRATGEGCGARTANSSGWGPLTMHTSVCFSRPSIEWLRSCGSLSSAGGAPMRRCWTWTR